MHDAYERNNFSKEYMLKLHCSSVANMPHFSSPPLKRIQKPEAKNIKLLNYTKVTKIKVTTTL